MDKRRETVEYLIEKVGVSPEEAERIMADDDLFLSDPGSRCGYEPEEAAEIWAEAQDKLLHLAEAASEGELFDNMGVSMLLDDAFLRAAVLRRRAEERAGAE
jgi:hypothetical protein